MRVVKGKITSVDEYIHRFPKEIQVILGEIREAIQAVAPHATEVISYGIPTFTYKGEYLVHFAAYKHHIGFYPTPSGIEAFHNELTAYKQSKGTVQFPLNKPIPIELIKRIVAFRIVVIDETV